MNNIIKTVGVSVIIPCYRCIETIERAIISVSEQTLIPFELILVDDYSQDGTLPLLYKIQSKYSKGWIKIIESQSNSGAATARNLGWEAATQDFIAFLDSDDSWHPQKIEIQYGWMLKNPQVQLTGHLCIQIANDSNLDDFNIDYTPHINEFHPVSKYRMLLSNHFSTPSVMLRRNLKFKFKDGKRYSEDYLLWAEIICSGNECYLSKLPLAYLYKSHYGEGGLSAQLWNMEKGEINTYWNLYHTKNISMIFLFTLISYSFNKYILRLLIQMVKH